MKRLFVVAVFLVMSSAAHAQVPYIQIYYDEYLSQTVSRCPEVSFVTDTLYVVAHNFNMMMSSIEYRIEYAPGNAAFLRDLLEPGTSGAGHSQAGIVVTFATPKDATPFVLVQAAEILWLCMECENAGVSLFSVFPHPDSDKIQAARWPDGEMIEAVGLAAQICPLSVDIEETTWGGIKALYR